MSPFQDLIHPLLDFRQITRFHSLHNPARRVLDMLRKERDYFPKEVAGPRKHFPEGTGRVPMGIEEIYYASLGKPPAGYIP